MGGPGSRGCLTCCLSAPLQLVRSRRPTLIWPMVVPWRPLKAAARLMYAARLPVCLTASSISWRFLHKVSLWLLAARLGLPASTEHDTGQQHRHPGRGPAQETSLCNPLWRT